MARKPMTRNSGRKRTDYSASSFVASKNEPTNKVVAIPEVISVKDFSDRAGLPVTQVITALIKNGVLASINQTIDYDTAVIVGDDLGVKVQKETKVAEVASRVPELLMDSTHLVPRTPVVTIMGHVDHGKTTLLDFIRQANVASRESGGITQHISAYQVVLSEAKHKGLEGRTITFIDTPGHAAFSKMREHGATITDIVVLIVAANDGVQPQTVEVIEDAKASNVPMIIAINKVDLPDADVMKVKQQLAEYDLVPEEWGGKTVMLEISAKTGLGVNDLLETLLLQADMMDLKADPSSGAIGVVIESHLEKGTGNVAIILIENGTLRVGDPVAIGGVSGKIRIMLDYSGKRIDSAGPSTPVKIAGLRSLPSFGDRLIAFKSEKEARDAAGRAIRTQSTLNIATAQRVQSSEESAETKTQDLNLVIKSDVAGSLEAIKKLISEIDSKEVSIKIISEGVGAIAESDVTLAQTTHALVYGFRVPVLMAAKKIAETENIYIKTYEVIYKMIDDIKAEVSKLLKPEITESETGTISVLAIFRDDKKAFVAGGKVLSGQISVGDEVKVFQDNNEKYRDKITSLRQGKNEVKTCAAGIECGLAVAPGANIAVGDKVVAFTTIVRERTIQ